MKYAALLTAVLLTGTASAQAVDFGAWCAKIAQHSQDRCLENRPEDRAAYDAYAKGQAQFDGELLTRDAKTQAERDQTDRMGDVTPDQTRDRSAADSR